MIPYKKMYFHLFNGISDALEALDAGDAARARALLILAQQEGEELYVSAGEETPQGSM